MLTAYRKPIVNTVVYSFYSCVIVLTSIMCLTNVQNAKMDPSYINLMKTLRADITHTVEACEYLEPDDSWQLESENLLIMQLNVRGLSSKVDQIKRLIDMNPCNKPPEVILLCETWLNDSSPTITIPGYNLELENRIGKKGGGVAILIKENLIYKNRPDLKPTVENTRLETCFIELKGTKSNLILGSLYHPPNNPPKEFLKDYSKILENLSKEKLELILVMDHNLDFLKINQHRPTEEFLECNIESGMIPQITKPTRITQTSATLIDNVIVSKKLSTHTESRIMIENISDHLPSLVSISNFDHIQKERVKIYSRDTRKQNLTKLREALENINWDIELDPHRNNLDTMTEKFQRLLGENIDHFTPYRERTINHKKIRKEKWVTGALLISIQKGKKLYKKSISSQATDADRKRYHNYMLVLRKVKRFAKKKYYLDRCVDFRSNTRELWKTINQVIGKNNNKSTCIQELKTDNLMIMRQKDIANELGKFFSTVGENFASKTHKSDKGLSNYLSLILRNKNSIFLTATSTYDIGRLIDKLPNKKSSFYDQVDNILLKSIRNVIAVPLSKIFNESLSQGIFPTFMKLAEIVPLYKGKDCSEKSNYRPISLLLTSSKLLEKIMYK